MPRDGKRKRTSLSAQQQCFVDAYLRDPNAGRAAAAAGSKARNTVTVGTNYLCQPKIRKAIAEAQMLRSTRVQISTDDVLRELHALAFVDVGDAFDERGDLKDIHQMSPTLRKAISSVDVECRTEGRGESAERITVKKIRFWDKKGTLELLGKHLKMFTEVHEFRGLEGLNDRIRKARVQAYHMPVLSMPETRTLTVVPEPMVEPEPNPPEQTEPEGATA